MSRSPNLSGPNLGGGYEGISPQQTITNYKSSDQTRTRRILRDSWNTAYATGTYNGYKRVVTPFRAVNNAGDFLARQYYTCGGPNQVNAVKPGMKNLIGSIISHCDNTGVPAGSGNSKYVYDSSDYITFKRQQAVNQNYNDYSFGGYNNGSYSSIIEAFSFLK
jgi:hypothetical protein